MRGCDHVSKCRKAVIPHFSFLTLERGTHRGKQADFERNSPNIDYFLQTGERYGEYLFYVLTHRDCALQFFYVFVLDFLTQNPENLRIANLKENVANYLRQMNDYLRHESSSEVVTHSKPNQTKQQQTC